MKELLKKWFYPRKNYVKILENYDEDSLNEFFYEVNKKGGRVIDIKYNSINKLESTLHETEMYSGNYVSGLESSMEEKIIIHYKCFEKVNYLTEKKEN